MRNRIQHRDEAQIPAEGIHSVYFSKRRVWGHFLTNPCFIIIFLCHAQPNLHRHGLRQEIFTDAVCNTSGLAFKEGKRHCSKIKKDEQKALG